MRTLSFLGDVVLDKAYEVNVPLDDFVFNLEHPLSCQGIPARNKVNFCAERSFIEKTFGKMPLAVNLANNHIADFGDAAFLKTLDFLRANEIAYFGAGKAQDNFNNPAIIPFEGKHIALLGYSCPSTNAIFGDENHFGSAKLMAERIVQDINYSKKKADLVVINLHWGVEDIRYPKPEDVKLARGLIDAGADLLIGHHAHVIQSFEKYKGKNIFYGLGHFIFPYKERPSYYDGDKFLRVHNPKPSKSNREGLIVYLKADENQPDYETIYFDDFKVRKVKAWIPRWVPERKSPFRLYRSLVHKWRLINHFIDNPRLPTLSMIKRFMGD
jgi:poly-gamma-glutamate synthesis protein (capsule biosynthesis protein)